MSGHAPRYTATTAGRHSSRGWLSVRGRILATFTVATVVAAGIGLGVTALAQPGVISFGGGASEDALAAASPSPSPEVIPPEEIMLSWGPSLADWDFAQNLAANLTVEQASGQVIVGHFAGTDPADAVRDMRRYHLGGVIVFDHNLGERAQVIELTEAVQSVALDTGRAWPAIVSVDQEGGTVARLSYLIPEMPAFMAAGAATDKAAVEAAYKYAGRDILDLGFNVNFAPVADMTIGLSDPVIRTRSAGSDPDNVARTVVAASNGFLSAGVLPAIKHFPGHGSVKTDSHVALPVQNTSLDALATRDFVSFQAAIDANQPMIMMGHIRIPAWGKGSSTLNPQAYAYLRDTMGFEGVVITDALNMRAVTDGNSAAEAAVKALNAGADILLMPENIGDAHAGIVAAVASGEVTRERLNEAAARSIAMMLWQSSLDDGATSEKGYARDFGATSIVLAAKTCASRYVGDSVRITGAWQSERDALAAALNKHGVGLSSSGTHVHLLGSPDGTANADVVVAMDGPWGLARSNADVYVGLYGRGDPALGALADVLVGEVAPGGEWPVSVGNIGASVCHSLTEEESS